MIAVHADARSIARARAAVNHARDHVTAVSGALRVAGTAPIADVPGALEAAQTALEACWEDLAYIATELTAALGGDT